MIVFISILISDCIFCKYNLLFFIILPTLYNTYLLPTYLPTYLHTYLPTYLDTYLPTYLPTFLPTYVPAYLLTYIPTYLPTYLPAYRQTDRRTYIMHAYDVCIHDVSFFANCYKLFTIFAKRPLYRFYYRIVDSICKN